MPAKRGNRNAAGQRVRRERVKVALSLSEGNGLLPLFVEMLDRRGEEATNERIIEIASDWAYQGWQKRLEDELRKDERLSVRVTIVGSDRGGTSTMSEVAFGIEEARATQRKMVARLKSEGITVVKSQIVPDTPSYGSASTQW